MDNSLLSTAVPARIGNPVHPRISVIVFAQSLLCTQQGLGVTLTVGRYIATATAKTEASNPL